MTAAAIHELNTVRRFHLETAESARLRAARLREDAAAQEHVAEEAEAVAEDLANAIDKLGGAVAPYVPLAEQKKAEPTA